MLSQIGQDTAITEQQVRIVKAQMEKIQKLKKVKYIRVIRKSLNLNRVDQSNQFCIYCFVLVTS